MEKRQPSEFIELQESRTVEPKDFLSLDFGGSSDQFKESPPTSTMAKGIPEGGRNTSMFNVAVMFKKMDPDNWKRLLKILIQTIVIPLASDIVTIQGQMEKKEYFYT